MPETLVPVLSQSRAGLWTEGALRKCRLWDAVTTKQSGDGLDTGTTVTVGVLVASIESAIVNTGMEHESIASIDTGRR